MAQDTNTIKINDILISYSGLTIAFANSGTFSISSSMLDKTTFQAVVSAGLTYKLFEKGDIDWSLSVDGLASRQNHSSGFTGSEFLLEEMLNPSAGKTITWRTSFTGDKYLQGNAILESYEESTSEDDLPTFSASFKGSGQISILTVA